MKLNQKKYNRTLLALGTVLLSLPAWAQRSSVDSVLAQIARNNRSLATVRQAAEARKLESRIGQYPANPFVEYDYLPGRPEGAGTQQEFAITQSFDFPSVYGYRKQVIRRQALQADLETQAERQNLLLEARLHCLDLIYHNKRGRWLAQRLAETEALLAAYGQRLAQADISVLDVNKARLQLVSLQQDVRRNESESVLLAQKLTELNGGQVLSLSDTLYPSVPDIPPFAALDSIVEAQDPALKAIRHQLQISKGQVSLNRALSLPRPEVGYHYQSILGQRYQGIHAGITIPLFEHKNTVAAARARVVFAGRQLEEHRLEHYHQLLALYTQYQQLATGLSEYRQLLDALDSKPLLDKSLRLGQITTIEYFSELALLYASWEKYQGLEREYHLVAARLLKYQLQ